MDAPRPQFERELWLPLDGEWELACSFATAKIRVPFPPEAPLSLYPASREPLGHLSYRRTFRLPPAFRGRRLFLTFLAVDQTCRVFVNGKEAFSHRGGYLPFSGEITALVDPGRDVLLEVEVDDPMDGTGFGYGKQSRRPGGIWYHAFSGIWQSVFLEAVPFEHISDVRIEPDIDRSLATIQVVSESTAPCAIEVDGRTVRTATNTPTEIPIPSPRLWSPESPALYPFEMRLGDDRVRSYFGMRKFGLEDGVLTLNNRPCFHSGVLDQGWWPDSICTPPSEAAMRADIAWMKAMGFNTLRKHVKVESPRWYHLCDTMGMIVWQDLPSGGGPYSRLATALPALVDFSLDDGRPGLLCRRDEASKRDCLSELREMVLALRNVPSIALWVPFNEGWGQFDSTRAARMVKELDPSRVVDNASGWHDQGEGELRSLHVYFRPYKHRPDPKGRAVVLSEFGGYNLAVEGHSAPVNFGYKRQESPQMLEASIQHLYRSQIIPARKAGLAAAIYTQLSDVETELNGLLTFDRQVAKVRPEAMRQLNRELIYS